MRKSKTVALALTLIAAWPHALGANSEMPISVLPSGASWIAEVPDKWNGTLLLFSHGAVNGQANPPRNRPRNGGSELLDRGFALAGSSYATTGWAVEDAVSDQLATLDAFIARYGPPRKVIAIGESMGGLVSLALAERHASRIDGALPICASVGGAVGMMNQALDGAFVLSTLVPAPYPIRLVQSDSQRSNEGSVTGPSSEVRALLGQALASPSGRARIALTAAIAQLPIPSPQSGTLDARLESLGAMVPRGVFFPRRDQERRAGGNFSWNTGIDYRRQLIQSGQYGFVEAAYKAAGLNLRADLDTLARTPRISAEPAAVAYIREHYTPTGRIVSPVLTIHEIGDPATMVTYESGYRDAVATAGNQRLLRQAFVDRQTHCALSAAEVVSGVLTLQDRIVSGQWHGRTTARRLNALAAAEGLQNVRFLEFRPAPFLRACDGKRNRCVGEDQVQAFGTPR